jgi:DNA replication protein
MKNYPDNSQSIYIPSWFFHDIILQVKDRDELKILLLIIHLIRQKKIYPGFIAAGEITSDVLIRRNINSDDADELGRLIEKVLTNAVDYGMLLKLTYKSGGNVKDLYFMNTAGSQNTIDKFKAGKIILKGIEGEAEGLSPKEEIKNIYSLYEQNIGMLTPIIAEQLKLAEKTYPADWIQDAFHEAVDLNKRNWRYIQRILENWATEGKSDGTNRRNIKKDKDPDRFIKGKYGHMVQR